MNLERETRVELATLCLGSTALRSRRRYHAHAQGQSGRQKRCQQSVLAKDTLAIGGGLFEAGEVRIVLAEEEVRGDEQAHELVMPLLDDTCNPFGLLFGLMRDPVRG